MLKIKNAILSVSNKQHLIEFAQELVSQGVEIFSTGGTLEALKQAGIAAKSISDYTGFPEIMNGRVKTLHPKIHGGILARSDNEDDLKILSDHQILKFDLICINLYPFEKVSAELRAKKVDNEFSEEALDKAIENIDIGGPTMIRAAAKNYRHTSVVVDASQYDDYVKELKASEGISLAFRQRLAREAFSRTSQYDAGIADFFNEAEKINLPEIYSLGLNQLQTLRYGENPHQKAGFYFNQDLPWEKLQGKELSYNNLLDLDAAIRLVADFDRPICAIFKHTNPCGVATGDHQLANLKNAIACDPVSHFGGIISLNETLKAETADHMAQFFYEIIVAPDFESEALEILAKKKNLRVVKCKPFQSRNLEIKNSSFGYLLQEADNQFVAEADLKVVTKIKPSPEDIQELLFAFRLVKFVKSNAIVFTKDGCSLAIGAGQMSRVDSMEIAISKAIKADLSLNESYLASDAFFPFRDGVDAAIKAGAKAIIQPGGSMRDQESIDAADEAGIAMVFTGMRHFRH